MSRFGGFCSNIFGVYSWLKTFCEMSNHLYNRQTVPYNVCDKLSGSYLYDYAFSFLSVNGCSKQTHRRPRWETWKWKQRYFSRCMKLNRRFFEDSKYKYSACFCLQRSKRAWLTPLWLWSRTSRRRSTPGTCPSWRTRASHGQVKTCNVTM